MPSGQLHAQLSAEQRGVRASDANVSARIQEGADETLPLRHLLHFIQINRRARVSLIKDGEHSGKILGTEAVEAGILALDGDGRCAFALTDLLLERAFAATADAGENEGVGRHSGRPTGLTMAQDLVRRSLQKGWSGQHGQDCIS